MSVESKVLSSNINMGGIFIPQPVSNLSGFNLEADTYYNVEFYLNLVLREGFNFQLDFNAIPQEVGPAYMTLVESMNRITSSIGEVFIPNIENTTAVTQEAGVTVAIMHVNSTFKTNSVVSSVLDLSCSANEEKAGPSSRISKGSFVRVSKL